MHTITAEHFSKKAWEVLPEYKSGLFGMNEAIEYGEGSCLHRSIVIGREALRLGVPVMRRITFGFDQYPNHYSNYLHLMGETVHISTGRHIPSYTVGAHPYELDFCNIYAVFGGEANIIDLRNPPKTLRAIIIPEKFMNRYSSCHASFEFIDQSCKIMQDTLDQGGESAQDD